MTGRYSIRLFIRDMYKYKALIPWSGTSKVNLGAQHPPNQCRQLLPRVSKSETTSKHPPILYYHGVKEVYWRVSYNATKVVEGISTSTILSQLKNYTPYHAVPLNDNNNDVTLPLLYTPV